MSLLTELGDDQRVAPLKIPDLIAKVTGERDDIIDLSKLCNGWQRNEYDERRDFSEHLMASFKKNFELLLEYLPALETVKVEVKAERLRTNRKARDAKGDMVDVMKNANVPLALAKAIVERVFPLSGDERFSAYSDWHAGTALKTTSTFDRPLRVVYGTGEDTYWHTHLNELYRSQTKVAQDFSRLVARL